MNDKFPDKAEFYAGMTYKEGSKWAVVLAEDVTVSLPLTGVSQEFLSGSQLLGRLDARGMLTICKGYACDGYSPTLRVLGRWLRLTPTPKAGFLPAVLHDFTRQFTPVEGCLWTRKNTDEWFYDALLAGGVHKHLAGIYYSAVSGLVGNLWHRLTPKSSAGLRIESLP